MSMDGIWEPNLKIPKARKSAKNCGVQPSSVMRERSSMLPLPPGLKPYKLVHTKFHSEVPLSFTATTEAQLSQSPAEPHACDPQSRPSLTLGRLCWAPSYANEVVLLFFWVTHSLEYLRKGLDNLLRKCIHTHIYVYTCIHISPTYVYKCTHTHTHTYASMYTELFP